MIDTKKKIIQKFNAELGSDLKGLEKIYDFHQCLTIQKNEIEKSLSMASSEAPSKVKVVIENVERISIEFQQLEESSIEFRDDIQKAILGNDKSLEMQKVINVISYLDKSLAYLNLIKYVEKISAEVQASLAAGDDEATISLYTNLTDISYQLQSSTCHHLVNYVKETLHFWHSLIKDKLSKEESTKPVVTSALLTDFTPVCLPISLMVRPLRQRFIYHFIGAKLTNRQDKPEWFFTQILTWIKDHVQWVQKNVQPVANSIGFNHVNMKVEFMRALVQLAVEKLHSELSVVQYDDALFAHLVDEALGFERELRETLFYPATQPATVFILTQAHIFVKWINMEKKYATEKMDAILSSNTAWEKLSSSDSDDIKVTECADAFLTLLTTISDRYKHLPQPGHRLQFLELQLELIDDWRIRLLQLLHENYENPLTSLMPCILNTLHYVATVLEEWGVTVHFLQLYFFKKQFEAVETATLKGSDMTNNVGEVEGSVFDEAVALLRRLEKELINEISDSVALDVKARSRPYRTDKWFAMQSAKEVVSLSVTPSGYSMFQELATQLNLLYNTLASPLFHQAWKNLAAHFDQFLLEEVVLVNHFNTGGAEQLQYDVVRNLFPLFGLYISKPESFFPLIKEACILLNILLGSVMLLLEALNSDDDIIGKEILADIGVHKMPPDLVLKVIRTRTDITYV
ncbi:RAD50 interactor 1 isoform X2 [Andrena cerasifolii]|uniref:RAD50 interactor 1 isoform X2 n=1 Tax=Andrena cerasifolii TaxID=2819439 RepID=UPI004037B1E1